MTLADNSSPHYRNCNLCEAICGVEITMQPGGRLDIRGDKDDPFSRGISAQKPSRYKTFTTIKTGSGTRAPH